MGSTCALCAGFEPVLAICRLQEYDVGEVITPLGAPKFVERAQVWGALSKVADLLPASSM